MKLFFGTLLILIFNQLCFSQNGNKIEFIGTLAIKGGDVLSYKIIFNQSANNEIKGYSITDFYGENLTRTSIKGIYDTVNNTLLFNELSNINNKKNMADSTFCFVSTETLKIRNIKGNKIISGSFKGLYPSGEFCAEGMIYLVESKIVDKIKEKLDSVPVKNQGVIIVKDTAKVLKSNYKLMFDHSSQNVSVDFWDGYVADNDMITVYLNDKILKENIILTSKKYKINIPASEKKLKLKIVALNEGDSGLNTLDFTIKNSIVEKKYISILKKGESFEIEFDNK